MAVDSCGVELGNSRVGSTRPPRHADASEAGAPRSTSWTRTDPREPGSSIFAARALDEGRRMRFCSPEELARLWEDAGLVEVEVGPVVVRATYRDFDDLWAPLEAGVAPSGAFCVSLPPARRAALRHRFAERLGSPDGSFQLEARAWAVLGRA